MDANKQVLMLQMAYAGALADAVLQLNKESVLINVTERKRREQLATGTMHAAQFGIAKPEEVFLKLAELFGCAQWEIINNLKAVSPHKQQPVNFAQLPKNLAPRPPVICTVWIRWRAW